MDLGVLVITVPAFRCLWTVHDDLNLRGDDKWYLVVTVFKNVHQRSGLLVSVTS